MTLDIDPLRVTPGDVILVFTGGKGGVLNILGQTLLRVGAILSGDSSRARYSHVMLGFSQGVVIHADGKFVRIQPLVDALAGGVARKNIRAMRLVQPPFDDGSLVNLVSAAELYFRQKYSFVLGRRSSLLGRLFHRGRQLTYPFCSELVAAAYAAVGCPIGERPPDRTLPIDLERSCVPPAWKDVTSEYIRVPTPELPGDELIAVGDRQLTYAQLFEEADRLLLEQVGRVPEIADARYELAKSLVMSCVLVQRLRGAELDLSKKLEQAPILLFQEFGALVRKDISSLDSFYAQVSRGLDEPAPSFASALQQEFPTLAADRRPYENFPSVETLRALELTGASLAFGAIALRLETALLCIAVGLGCPIDAKSRTAGISRDVVTPFVEAIPPLRIDEMNRLLAQVDRLSMPTGKTYSDDIRRKCGSVVKLHAVLSTLKYGVGPDVAAP
jgi:hypothetical protein